MTKSVRTTIALLATIFTLTTGPAGARQSATTATTPQWPSLAQPVPLDSETTTGTLANGLRYYIRKNTSPLNRAELRLVVNAGTVAEEDDQQGFAHLIEHMAFKGTQHFPGQEVETFLLSLGNASTPHFKITNVNPNSFFDGTNFDWTTFKLSIPTDKPEVTERAFSLLEDWAHALTFDPEALARERNVVMDEGSLGLDGATRLAVKSLPLLFQGSHYAERLPFGKPGVLQSVTPERLKKFYADWYRPDLMAVVAIGDFDKATIETLITNHFSGLTGPTAPRQKRVFDIPEHSGTRYGIAADKDFTFPTTISVVKSAPHRDPNTVGAYRQKIVEELFSQMLLVRLLEVAKQPGSPFNQQAAWSRDPAVGGIVNVRLRILVARNASIIRAVDEMFTEIGRIVRFGFTQDQLKLGKEVSSANPGTWATVPGTRESIALMTEYVGNFLQKEPAPSSVYQYELYRRFMPEITLEEINEFAKEWSADRNRFVWVSAPETPGIVLPDATELAATVKASVGKPLQPYANTTATLLDTVPVPGAIVKTSTNEVLEITEWELSNGAKVILKPTTFKEDEILLQAFSPGGDSLASDEDYIPASTSSIVVGFGGLGKNSRIELARLMDGKDSMADAYIADLFHGVTGKSSRNGLETMFQVVYLRFTQPRADAAEVAARAANEKRNLSTGAATSELAFNKALSAALYQNHLRLRQNPAETVDQWNLDKSMAFYKERFADAGNFTFVFAGSFDLATLRPLVERYLASLPSTGRHETWRDVGMRYVTGVVEKRVEKGVGPRSQVGLVFTGPVQYEMANHIALEAMARELRRKLGFLSINVRLSIVKIPRPEYSLTISFSCNPQRADEMVNFAMHEIDRLQTNSPTPEQLNNLKAAFQEDFERSMKDNNWLIGQIQLRLLNGEGPATLMRTRDYIQTLDAVQIQNAARTYLNKSNYVKVILAPEKK